MLINILNWIYILFTIFCMGFAFSKFSEKVLHYSFKRVDTVLMTGLVIATVYAQIFSLFYRVSIEANIIMLLCCVVICITMGKKMISFLKDAFRSCSLSRKIIIALLFLAWSYFTSRGYMVYDMNLYHGQSIRWIEEYGVVKGLGNLHSRFGYNSSVFAVSALYSMKFIFGRSLHAVNGLIAFLLSVGILDLGKAFSRKRMLLSDYARVGAIYYLTTIWDEIIAPSSDYAVMCTVFFIVIKWLAQLEEEDESRRNNIAPYALLCVAAVYALTLKVSAGLILILLIKPAYMLLKEKRWKEICIYLVLGLVVAVPWFARTVIITGWLLYPFPALDLFDFDWKMTDVEMIKIDAALIGVWAKGANSIGLYPTLEQWFPNWFKNELFTTEKLLILADIFSCFIVVIMTIVILVKKQWQKLDSLLVLLTMFGCYLFWQFSAPMTRYGYAYVLLMAALTFGYLLEHLKRTKVIFYVFFILYGIYKLSVGVDYIKDYSFMPFYVWQDTYGEYELEAYELDGVTMYYSPYGGVTGYDPFPSATDMRGIIELRGDGLEDGFRLVGE